jgi:lipopolysaccharide transport system ATP-binding protein
MSNSDVVIRVEGLGKKYSLHHEHSERYMALRDVVARQAKAAGRLLNPFTLAGQLRKAQRQVAEEHAASEEEFWALKDVSFEIRRGERVGIIGRNGAGKSTLLKILSRITEPTTGRVEIRGRVASLLEVGTGFHPELTGRENIYLNGAILGMIRRDICSKFDEIVAFAEVEKFLDMPVKRYSSGMYVRLAFAVAAHLEPEILVVDEVLAVGDANFQKKCLGKMEDVAERQGRTVLFVSHQISAIERLCSSAILLEAGKVRLIGNVNAVTLDYLKSASNNLSSLRLDERKDRKGSQSVVFTDISVRSTMGRSTPNSAIIKSGEDMVITINYKNILGSPIRSSKISIDFLDEKGNICMIFQNVFEGFSVDLDSDTGQFDLFVPCVPLAEGLYQINLFMATSANEILDWISDVLKVTVCSGDFFGTGSLGLPSHCKILVRSRWTSKASYQNKTI